ncbi:Suppressor of the cold-sensitive snRNP bioproteinsis mutant brr1-1 [Perkinsus chesapeaki]|uniref:subtilisin n=1 Tax=Perkinsus chesapeaki TaxID=330153 RepID=A0A7J6MHP9_PERCH|nr:Suppressor of the cold-sensitive snRNP bioproteinsis mutant brr1-1 [Perkinsus chesapeaki]
MMRGPITMLIFSILAGALHVEAERLESAAAVEPRIASVVGEDFKIEDLAGPDGEDDDIHSPYRLIITTNPNSGDGRRRLASLEDRFRKLNSNNMTLHAQFTTLINSIKSTKALDTMSLELITLHDTNSYSPEQMCEIFMDIQHAVNGDYDDVFCGPDAIVSADATVPNDPSYTKQYQHALINTPQAWDMTTGDDSLVVALIDSGIDYTHPDLANNIWVNPGEIPGDGIDNDGNGYIDDVNGWDFHGDTANPMDQYGHGTHVGGILAAQGNNGRGVTGVSWKVSIAPLRFLNEKGKGYLSSALEAIDYAISMNIKLSVNSWSCTGCSVPTLETAVRRAGDAGHLFVASSGNKQNDNDVTPTIPCGFNLDNIICVAATDSKDIMLSNSNYGATTVDIAAPGGSIYSTKPSNTYAYMSGTSMATPMVAGAAALMLAVRPQATAAQIKASILSSAKPVAGLNGKCVSGGRLDVFGALNDITSTVSASSVSTTTISPCEQAANDACAALDNGSWCQLGVAVSTCGGSFSIQCPCSQNRRALEQAAPEHAPGLHV